jgi:hypothetical protein
VAIAPDVCSEIGLNVACELSGADAALADALPALRPAGASSVTSRCLIQICTSIMSSRQAVIRSSLVLAATGRSNEHHELPAPR